MEIDIARLCATLDAEYELLALPDNSGPCHIYRFRDCLLRYELAVDEPSGSITLAADPEKPIQACPLLEFSFSRAEIEIGENPFPESTRDVIRFWGHRHNHGGIRLTLTPRPDGRWYIWANAWEGR